MMVVFGREKQAFPCPHCGAALVDLDDADRPGKTSKPSRGGVAVCYGCARPSVFAGRFRPENRAETVKHMRDGRYVLARAEAMFRGDAEFARRWAALEDLMSSW